LRCETLLELAAEARSALRIDDSDATEADLWELADAIDASEADRADAEEAAAAAAVSMDVVTGGAAALVMLVADAEAGERSACIVHLFYLNHLLTRAACRTAGGAGPRSDCGGTTTQSSALASGVGWRSRLGIIVTSKRTRCKSFVKGPAASGCVVCVTTAESGSALPKSLVKAFQPGHFALTSKRCLNRCPSRARSKTESRKKRHSWKDQRYSYRPPQWSCE
jgi:hypothetical protein